MPPIPPVTQALMLINVGLFCLQSLTGPWVEQWFALWPATSGLFMPWQVVSYGFLHGSFNHLLFNMIGLWMFGAEMERLWGGKRLAYFFIASVLGGAIAQLVLTAVTGAMYPTVGASAGLFGLMLGYALVFPNRVIVPLIPPIPMKARTFVAIYGCVELFLGVTGTMAGVAHFAHLGGMVGAWLLMRYWRGQSPFGQRRR